MRVLVVDDEMLIRLGIKTILENNGTDYEFIGSASSGDKGLQMVKELAPDIVITDIKMPIMDGIQLIKEIKNYDDTIGILVISNYSDFELVKEAMKHGADEYILKIKMVQESLIEILSEVANKVYARRKNGKRKHNNTSDRNKSIKLIISDMLSNMSETENDGINLFDVEPKENQICQTTSICLNCNINNDKTIQIKDTIEDIVENIINEYCNGWCTKIGDYEYAIILIFTKSIHQDEFVTIIQKACQHCLKVIYELLNITGIMFIGSLETKPRRLERSLKKALRTQNYIMNIKGISKDIQIYEFEKIKEETEYNLEISLEKDGAEDSDSWKGIYGRFELSCNEKQIVPFAIHNAILYLNEYYGKDITLNEVADVVNLNPSYFSTLFNSTLKITFSNYLMCLRISKAKILLKETSYKIYEIAEMVGYKNSYYFSRIFKKIIGITPMEYRNE